MSLCHALVSAVCLFTVDPVETRFLQVAPVPRSPTAFLRSPKKDRAVVLIHGLSLHPFSNRNVGRAKPQGWQEAGSLVVTALARDADVFAFAYSQNVPVDRIAGTLGLRRGLGRVRQMGYREVVLVGHSAGGLIARQLVEDCPDVGVTKVVQVCAPNTGSGWARATLGVRERQEPFLDSLTKPYRRTCCERRCDKCVAADVEFVCLVCRLGPFGGGVEATAAGWGGRIASLADLGGDGLVSTASQWPEDLQKQGVPAVALAAGHFTVVRSKSGAEKIAEAVRSRQPRWDAEQVARARRQFDRADDADTTKGKDRQSRTGGSLRLRFSLFPP